MLSTIISPLPGVSARRLETCQERPRAGTDCSELEKLLNSFYPAARSFQTDGMAECLHEGKATLFATSPRLIITTLRFWVNDTARMLSHEPSFVTAPQAACGQPSDHLDPCTSPFRWCPRPSQQPLLQEFALHF